MSGTFTGHDYTGYDATALAAAIRTDELSPAEIADRVIAAVQSALEGTPVQ